MSRCSSCKAEIVWAWSGKKPMPIDADPVLDGNVELANPEGDELIAKVWGTAHVWPDDMPRYRSHFATCPDAERYRRPR
jgi:hypothetical protein